MTELDGADRLHIVRLLAVMPELATEQARRDLLVLAGLDELAPVLDVSGAPVEAVDRIVHYLTRLDVLGQFLNLVKGFVGDEQQAVLVDVLSRYELMVPAVRAPGIGTWRGSTDEASPRPDTVRPIAFLSAAVVAAHCVAHIVVTTPTESWSGTGFLVGPDLVLTTNHVLPRADLVLSASFRFDYQDDDCTGAPGGLFHTSRSLDYTLVQLADRPGDRWTYLPLEAETVAVGDRVAVIQHPGGRPEQVVMWDNVVEYVGGGVVQYVTSTLPGSAGAPVLTDEWRVCAVQCANGPFHRNEGVMTSAILRDLPVAVRSALPVGGGF